MKKIKLKEIMTGLQAQMDAKLSLSRKTLTHPGTTGDFTEREWLALLSEYLPKRYSVAKGFVVDGRGNVSHQLDIVIFDRHYTPFVFHQNGATYIPAEAVYAVIECKQDISKANIRYAATKAMSVRRLHRTSLPIRHVGGTAAPKEIHNIFCGLVCVGGKISKPVKSYLENLEEQRCLNFVCSLRGTYFRLTQFDLWNRNDPPYKATIAETPLSLVLFTMNLISDLQAIGTVPAIDLNTYLSNL